MDSCPFEKGLCLAWYAPAMSLLTTLAHGCLGSHLTKILECTPDLPISRDSDEVRDMSILPSNTLLNG